MKINIVGNLLRRLFCLLTLGHSIVWNSKDPNEENMHCRKCLFKWSIWDNVGSI